MKRIIVALVACAVLTVASPARAGGRNGVSDAAAGVATAAPGNITFEPPCFFADTLPLKGPYLNAKTGLVFTSGGGAVLNECGIFGVVGYSSPNFLAWNCRARNLDGSVPSLPTRVRANGAFTVRSISLLVASEADAGKAATLVGYNAGNTIIARRSIRLAPEMQRLAIASARPIAYVELRGPCVMVADDLQAGR